MEVKKNLISPHTPDKEKTYELSALLDVDSFFYALLDSGGEVAKMDQISLNTKLELDQYPKLNSSKIAIANQNYTLVPESDYTKESLAEYVQHKMGPSLQNKYVYQADHLKESGLFVCYAIPTELYQYCFNFSAIPIFRHQVSVLISQINMSNKGVVIHVSRNNHNIVIIAHKGGQTTMASTFESRSPMTTLYYITLVQESIGAKKVDLDIEFSGDFVSGDKTERLVRRYFSKVRYTSSTLKMNGQLLENPSVYFPLQSVSLCV